VTTDVVWYAVKRSESAWIIWHLTIFDAPAPRLCHTAGGELSQIQFLLGPASVQTTERHKD